MDPKNVQATFFSPIFMWVWPTNTWILAKNIAISYWDERLLVMYRVFVYIVFSISAIRRVPISFGYLIGIQGDMHRNNGLFNYPLTPFVLQMLY